MSDDILSRIDEIIEAAIACLCGCQKPLRGGGDSPWFASEECQAAWNARRVAGNRKSSIEKVPVPASAPATVAEAVIRRMSRPHAASPYLTREDITGQRDRINDALRAVVREQGLDEETIRIEAIRLEGIPAPTWHPVTDVTPDGEPLTVTMRQARFEPRREIRVLVEGEEVYRGVPEPWPSEMSDGPDDSHIATRPRWWQWRPW